MTRLFVIVVVVALVFTAIRLGRLDLDPPLTKRPGDVSNEGYWLHNARMKVLTGDFRHDHFNQALATAPLYTVLTYASFRIGGLGLATGRLVSALSGILIVLAGFMFLWCRRGDGAWASTFALLLAVNDLFFAYNRIALVETTLSLFIFASFIALVAAYESRAPWPRLYLSGLCFGLALAVKLTVLYVLASFVLAYAIEWVAGNRRPWADVVPWIAGAGTAVVPFVVALEALYPGELARHIAIYSSAAGSGSGLYPRAVQVVFNPLRTVRNEFLMSFSIVLLTAILMVGLVERAKRAGSSLRSLLAASDCFERVCLAWIVGNLATAAYADLQPDRRYWTMLVPMVVIGSRILVVEVAERLGIAPRALPPVAQRGRMLHLIAAAVGVYALAPLLAAAGETAFRSLGLSVRTGMLQAAGLVVSAAIVAVTLWRGQARWLWYVVLIPLGTFALDWNISLVGPVPSKHVLSMAMLVVVALAAAYGLAALHHRGKVTVLATIVATYLVWNAAVIGQAFAAAAATVPASAREVDRLAVPVAGSTRYYVAGANAHELALESNSFPLFLGRGRFYTDLSRELANYPAIAPQFFLEAVRRGPDGGSLVQLPPGIDGTVLGTYCGGRQPVTRRCTTEIAVVKVSRFSLGEFIAAAPKELSR